VTIVQDPREAMFADMPINALKTIRVDYMLPVAEIAIQIIKLAKNPIRTKAKRKIPETINVETESAMSKRNLKDLDVRAVGFYLPRLRGHGVGIS